MINSEWADIALIVVIVAGVIAAFAIGFYLLLKLNEIRWSKIDKHRVIEKRSKYSKKSGKLFRIIHVVFFLVVGIIVVIIILVRCST